MPNILVVEDDPDLLNLIKKKLSDEGFAVTPVATGQAALDLLRQRRPDLVVLDILLPDIDGITILQQINSAKETKHIPVIIFSNLESEASLEQVAAIGSYTYLVKAKTELNDLVAVIRKKINSKE